MDSKAEKLTNQGVALEFLGSHINSFEPWKFNDTKCPSNYSKEMCSILCKSTKSIRIVLKNVHGRAIIFRDGSRVSEKC